MENNVFEVLIHIAQTDKKSISENNQAILKVFDWLSSQKTDPSAGRGLKALINVVQQMESQSLVSKWKSAIDTIMYNQERILGSIGNLYSLSDKLKQSAADLNANVLYNISRSNDSKMIYDLRSCFEEARYESMPTILNQALSNQTMAASDIAFLKMSGLSLTTKNGLNIPKGFTASLIDLNVSTANEIADNSVLQYNLEENVFISSEGQTDSKGLNIICSGKAIFEQMGEELFTEEELVDFNCHLSRSITRALAYETGQKIDNLIKRLFSTGEKTIGFDKQLFYHCRSRKKEEMPYTCEQMMRAPNGLSWTGRFNFVGQSYYYFADSKEGAETEIRRHLTKDEALQTVQLKPEKGINLLDLSESLARGKTFLRYLRFPISNIEDKMPREYLLPCFVGQCCKDIGFDGIKYHGSKEYKNYVAWSDGYFRYDKMYI